MSKCKLISQEVPIPISNCLFSIFYNYLQTQNLHYLLFFSSSFMYVLKQSPLTGKPINQMPNSVDSASTSSFSQALLNSSCLTFSSDLSLPFTWPIASLSDHFPTSHFCIHSQRDQRKARFLNPQTFKPQKLSNDLNTNSSTWHPRPHSPLSATSQHALEPYHLLFLNTTSIDSPSYMFSCCLFLL